MSFAVAGDKYDRFMGRYSRELAPRLIEFAGVDSRDGRRGRRLRARGAHRAPGRAAGRGERRRGGSVRAVRGRGHRASAGCGRSLAPAEELPWEDDRFDAALSQLVVNFMRDADAGVSEMRRVVRPGGVVAACTWSYGEDMEMLRSFWDAARTLDSGAPTRGAR